MNATAAMPKRERTRGELLEQALVLFQEQGFEKTTMRAIAEASGLSLGAAYYHFDSKEAMVLEFYRLGTEAACARSGEDFAATKEFGKRFRALLSRRIEQLAPYRELVRVLARHGADMASPLSPFGETTRALRERDIALLAASMKGSDLKCAAALAPHLPKLLWLLELGVVLYWANDRSPAQARTERLIDGAMAILVPLLRATTLPLMRPVIARAVELIGISESCLQNGDALERKPV